MFFHPAILIFWDQDFRVWLTDVEKLLKKLVVVFWGDGKTPRCQVSIYLGVGFKDFLFPPLLGEMIQFDLRIFWGSWVATNHDLDISSEVYTPWLTGDSLCDLHGGGPRGSEAGERLPGGVKKCTALMLFHYDNCQTIREWLLYISLYFLDFFHAWLSWIILPTMFKAEMPVPWCVCACSL